MHFRRSAACYLLRKRKDKRCASNNDALQYLISSVQKTTYKKKEIDDDHIAFHIRETEKYNHQNRMPDHVSIILIVIKSRVLLQKIWSFCLLSRSSRV